MSGRSKFFIQRTIGFVVVAMIVENSTTIVKNYDVEYDEKEKYYKPDQSYMHRNSKGFRKPG